jgi:Domain of unknown function (DUF4936)
MPLPEMDLYIYYRVSNEHSAQLQSQVMTLQKHINDQYEIRSSLKRRIEENVPYQTWMEIYFSVPDQFLKVIDHAVSVANLARWIEGERHTEIFVDMSQCA